MNRRLAVICWLTLIPTLFGPGCSDDETEPAPAPASGSPTPDGTRDGVAGLLPPQLPGADRELLLPGVRALVAGEPTAGEMLQSDELTAAFAGREIVVLEALRDPLRNRLESGDVDAQRIAVAVARHWTPAAVSGAGAEAVADRLPLEALEAVLSGGTERAVRIEVALLLAEVPHVKTFFQLQRALSDPDVVLRSQVVRALARGVGRDRPDDHRKRCASELIRHLEREEDDAVAASILSEISREPYLQSRPELKERVRALVDSESTGVRVAAARLAGILGDRAAIPKLILTASREDRDSREAAIEALGRLKSPEAKAALEAIEDPGEADPKLSKLLAWARGRQD